MTTLDVLKEARSLIAKGWTKGIFYCAGRYCAVGAVRKAAGGRVVEGENYVTYPQGRPGDDENGYFSVQDVLKELSSNTETIMGFNDSPQTTQDEVLAKFDEAIARLS